MWQQREEDYIDIMRRNDLDAHRKKQWLQLVDSLYPRLEPGAYDDVSIVFKASQENDAIKDMLQSRQRAKELSGLAQEALNGFVNKNGLIRNEMYHEVAEFISFSVSLIYTLCQRYVSEDQTSEDQSATIAQINNLFLDSSMRDRLRQQMGWEESDLIML